MVFTSIKDEMLLKTKQTKPQKQTTTEWNYSRLDNRRSLNSKEKAFVLPLP